MRESIKSSATEVGTHPFFALHDLSEDERRSVFGQWYIAARKHKELFPWLVAITKIDPVRYELIQILHDEYGKGNPLFIHGNLLEQTVRFLGIHPTEITPAKGNQVFAETTEQVWKNEKEPITSYGYHQYLEESSSILHKKLYALLHNVPDVYKLYSSYHEFAETEHARISAKGLSPVTFGDAQKIRV